MLVEICLFPNFCKEWFSWLIMISNPFWPSLLLWYICIIWILLLGLGRPLGRSPPQLAFGKDFWVPIDPSAHLSVHYKQQICRALIWVKNWSPQDPLHFSVRNRVSLRRYPVVDPWRSRLFWKLHEMGQPFTDRFRRSVLNPWVLRSVCKVLPHLLAATSSSIPKPKWDHQASPATASISLESNFKRFYKPSLCPKINSYLGHFSEFSFCRVWISSKPFASPKDQQTFRTSGPFAGSHWWAHLQKISGSDFTSPWKEIGFDHLFGVTFSSRQVLFVPTLHSKRIVSY